MARAFRDYQDFSSRVASMSLISWRRWEQLILSQPEHQQDPLRAILLRPCQAADERRRLYRAYCDLFDEAENDNLITQHMEERDRLRAFAQELSSSPTSSARSRYAPARRADAPLSRSPSEDNVDMGERSPASSVASSTIDRVVNDLDFDARVLTRTTSGSAVTAAVRIAAEQASATLSDDEGPRELQETKATTTSAALASASSQSRSGSPTSMQTSQPLCDAPSTPTDSSQAPRTGSRKRKASAPWANRPLTRSRFKQMLSQ